MHHPYKSTCMVVLTISRGYTNEVANTPDIPPTISFSGKVTYVDENTDLPLYLSHRFLLSNAQFNVSSAVRLILHFSFQIKDNTDFQLRRATAVWRHRGNR